MQRFVLIGALTTIAFSSLGCGEDQKTAERPKDVGYVAPEMPQADGGPLPKNAPK